MAENIPNVPIEYLHNMMIGGSSGAQNEVEHNEGDGEERQIPEAVLVNLQEDPQIENDDEIEKDLIFSPYYYVLRYNRMLRRAEVLGFGFVSLTIMSIALLSQLGLEALGYFVHPIADTSFHSPQSFSWKLLSEFYIADSLTSMDKDCLFANKKRLTYRRSEDHDDSLLLINNNGVADFINNFHEDNNTKSLNVEMATDRILPHTLKCGNSNLTDAWTWFCKYIYNMFLSIVGLSCAILLFSCVRSRRKKGLQLALMIPSFLCVFMGIFQQIPLMFHFSYTNVILVEDMQSAMTLTMPPMIISPIWEETQIHGECCGIQSPQTWMIHGFDSYPRSCCNTTAFSCNQEDFPKRNQIWSKGCYKQEYERVRSYELKTLFILLLKLIAEMGILWTLSDLTRYDYPRPEYQHTCTCDVKNYEIKTRGVAIIMGVTEHQKMAIHLRSFSPGKYRFGISQTGTLKTINIRTYDGLSGSIEIRQQRQPRNRNESPFVDLERGRNRGLIFIKF